MFDQYPDRNKLSTFVRRSLKLALDTIAPATLYGDALYQLVEWMDKNDLLRDLIHKGLKIRSDQKIDNLITSLSSTTRGTPTPEPTSASASTPTTRPIVLPRTLALQPPPGAIRKGVSAFVVPELLVNWTKRMQECARAVCRINLGSGLGTGFLIAPNLLLTAGHNINFIDGENGSTVRCEFDFQINAQGQAQTPVIYQLASEWLVDSVVPVVPAASANKTESKDSLDFALIRLADTPGLDLVPRTMDRRGWLTTDTSHTFAKGEPLFMLHHFQGAPLVLEHGKLHRAVTPEDVNIRLTSDTGIRAPGAGGAPCFDATWNVVAMRTQSDRSGKKLIISGPLIRTILQRPKMAEALKESLALATTVA